MADSEILPVEFYNRPVLQVARDLLGMRLVRQVDGVRAGGVIVETEAYDGEEDLACHARAGRTARTAVMYGPPGRAYVYFTYGMHWCLNAVSGPQDVPAAVLLRAVIPAEGLEWMATRRGKFPRAQWCNGPAKLSQALAVTGAQNGADLCSPDGGLWIERGQPAVESQVRHTPRVGIQNVPEPWRSQPWRFLMVDEQQMEVTG